MESPAVLALSLVLSLVLLPVSHALSQQSPLCGNGIQDVAEQCDDGNLAAGDGCSEACAVEAGWECTPAALPTGGTNRVVDGGFEAGTPSMAWQEMSVNFGTPICSLETCGGTSPATGNFHAWFGGIGGVSEQASVEQNVSIPLAARALVFNLTVTACDSEADSFTVTIDGTPVFSHPGCVLNFEPEPVVADISAFADGGVHSLKVAAQTESLNGGITSYFVDNLVIGDAPDLLPAPSVCGAAAQQCFVDDFNQGLGVCSTHSGGALQWNWSASDSGLCGTNNGLPGNFTGGDGLAACVDSDVAGSGLVDAYLCSPQLDFAGSAGLALDFNFNYQLFDEAGVDDRFEVLLSSSGPLGPFDATLYSTQANAGGLYALPGQSVHVDLSGYQDLPSAWLCFRYGGDFDWYAQVDDVRVTATSCSFEVTDVDGDGVVASQDNCTLVANSSQLDTDADGFGNACDPDIAPGAGDGVVNFLDLAVVKAAFFTIPGNPAWNPDADFNGDSNVNFVDVGILRQFLFQAPGPSGTLP